MNVYGKLRLENAAYREILGLLTEEEVVQLQVRQSKVKATGLNTAVNDILSQTLAARHLAASLKKPE